MSYAAEVIADNSGTWSRNGLRFATPEEAVAYARDLAGRWTLVRDYRATESADPVTHRWNGGLEACDPANHIVCSPLVPA